jgi:LacI family transcriptional regulator
MGVTIKQIALEVGLSWQAVSQILNNRGRIAPATREKVLAVAAKHGYRPNSSARALRDKTSKLIGVLFCNDADNEMSNMAALESLLGINQRFQDADLATILIRPGELSGENDSEPRIFRERLVDGVIVVGGVGGVPEPILNRIESLVRRVVWLDTWIWNKTCCVRRDEHAAGYDCVQALVSLGYQRITFVTREPGRRLGHHSHPFREAGAQMAAQANRVRLQVVSWPEDSPDMEYDALRDLLTPEVGIVAGSLPVARQIVNSADGLRRVPGYDFGIVCCDDSFDTQVAWRGLCRIGFDRYDLGAKAAEMMLSLLATPENPPPSHLQKGPFIPGCSAWGPTLFPRF